jgi:multiple sugar transport system permease protein
MGLPAPPAGSPVDWPLTRVAHAARSTIAAPLPQPRSGFPRLPVWVLFLAPTVLVLLAITIFPLVYSLALSLHAWTMGARGGWRWVGLQNFAMILRADPYFWTSVRVTLTYVGAAVGVELLLGLGIALLLNRRPDGRGGLVQTLLILPTMMTPVVVGIVWRLLYNPELGFLNYLLSLVGLPPQNWLGDLDTALAAVVIADIWEWTPFVALVLLAGLRAMPPEPFEAGAIDGASGWQVFRYITWPLLQPTILVAVLIRLMDAFKTFDLVFVLTKGGPGMSTEVLSYYTYRYGFKFFHMGYAAALSYILLLIVVLISQLFVNRLLRHEVEY